MKKLRLAILASDFIRVPPRPQDIPPGSSGAPEQIVSLITEAMVKKGHQVTLFAAGNSSTQAKLISLQKKSTGVDPSIGRAKHIDYEYSLISKCLRMANSGKFDLIHTHFDDRTSFFAPFCKIPIISTLHSPLVDEKKRHLALNPKAQYYVSISNAQRKNLPNLNYLKTIYHGIDTSKISFSAKHDNYLVFIGRMRKEKGPDLAIQIAKKLKKKLFLFGSHDDENIFWQKKVKPFIDQKQIINKGHVEKGEILKYLQRAAAFIFPIRWDEPFGLVLIEAMACGTPVIGTNHGSVPEIINPGKTGFIVNDIAGAITAFKKINTINRADCRSWVENKFSLSKMMDEYEKIYYKVTAKK